MRTPARKIEYETHNALLFIDYSAHKILTSFTDWHKHMQALDAGPKQIDEAGVRVEQENVNKASSDQMFSKS
jgi:hypothetical protein